MQYESLEMLVRMILDMIEEENRRVLFLITASHQEEEVLLMELRRLLERYPDSKVCMDRMSQNRYPRIQQDNRSSERLILSGEEVEKEVQLADMVAILSLDLSTLRKVSMGLVDNNVTNACMEALLHGKKMIAADDEYRSQLVFSGKNYRRLFEEAKERLESYGVTFCPLQEILRAAETGAVSKPAVPETNPAVSTPQHENGRRQLVTIETLARNPDLIIEDDAIITPAAKELLMNRK